MDDAGYTSRMFYDLTPKQTKFARNIFEGKSILEAYRASYNVANMGEPAIKSESAKVWANPTVKAYVDQLQRDASYVSQLTVAWVLKQYMQIATADVNELVEARRTCCRHCYGIGHAYQWKDVTEWATRLAEVMEINNEREQLNANPKLKRVELMPLPSDAGGFGYWATKEPVDTCTECFGVGFTDYHIHDTRKLKGAAKLLYAGVKPTKDGMQILTRNQDAALDYLAKYLGIDRKTLELVGPNGGPIKSISVATSDPAEAAKMYAALMGDVK